MMSSCQCYVHTQNPESDQQSSFISLAQCNGAFKFLIPMLVATVQVGVQGTTKSPLETQPAKIYIFLLATSVFCFVLTANTNCKIHHTSINNSQTINSQLFGVIGFISGSLSAVSLFSILVPSLLGYIIFIAWGLLSGFVSYKHAGLIKKAYEWLLERIKDVGWWIWKIFHKVINLWSNDQQRLPEVDPRL